MDDSAVVTGTSVQHSGDRCFKRCWMEMGRRSHLQGPARQTMLIIDGSAAATCPCAAELSIGDRKVKSSIASFCSDAALKYCRMLLHVDPSHQVLVMLGGRGELQPLNSGQPDTQSEKAVAEALAHQLLSSDQMLDPELDCHLGLQAVQITGIPMNKKAASDRALYDVPLLCRPMAGEDLGVVPVPALTAASKARAGLGSTPLVLKWLKAPKGFHAAGFACRQAALVLPEKPKSAPTQSLIKHLAAGKPVLLAPADDPATMTHIMLQRGSSIVLHQLWRDGQPSGPAASASPAEQRLYQSATASASGLRIADFGNLMDSQARLSAADLAGWGRLPDLASNPDLDLQTRYFPLQRSDTVTWGEEPPSPLGAMLRSIAAAFQRQLLSRAAVKGLSDFLFALQAHSQRNDAALVPQCPQDTFRRRVYSQAWQELRTLAATYGRLSDHHKELAAVVAKAAPPDAKGQPGGSVKGPKHAANGASAAVELPGARGGSADGISRSGSGLGSADMQAAAAGAPAGRGDQGGGAAAQQAASNAVRQRRRCEEVARDAQGQPVMPIALTPSHTVLCLGKVVSDRSAFHSQNYIWPVGFKSMRYYASMKQPDKRISYQCEILDAGTAPEFRIRPEDDPDNPIIGPTATAVWTAVVRSVFARQSELEGGEGSERPTRKLPSVSGPEYFGFAAPTIARLIQELPGADKCRQYQMQNYMPTVGVRGGARPASAAPHKAAGGAAAAPAAGSSAVKTGAGTASLKAIWQQVDQLAAEAPNVRGKGEAPRQTHHQQTAAPPSADPAATSGPMMSASASAPSGSSGSETKVDGTTADASARASFPAQFQKCSNGSVLARFWTGEAKHMKHTFLDSLDEEGKGA
ncbi:hypothetical protein WJX72_004523 [[Myrmecia] bisecta]|uniref:Uncharacterized protein n=1 Tax=[Myrmecia] bisecta TaxID=41462 RepID=A0AAW1QAL4_9CHLO